MRKPTTRRSPGPAVRFGATVWPGLFGWRVLASVGVAAIVAAAVPARATTAAAATPATAVAGRTLDIPSQATTARLEHRHGLAPGQTVHALVLGDSLGLTLAVGLSNNAQAWGVHVQNGAVIGCDLDATTTVNYEGSISEAAQGCADWPQTWAAEVRQANPDVVAIELGRWEVSDRIVNGSWTRIGEQPWDDLLGRLLNEAVAVVSQWGAKVVLFTLPYVQQTTTQPDGQPWDINQPIRTDQYNAIVRQVAARHRGVATVIDLNRLFAPAGHYTSYIDGVRVMNTDDEHPSIAGGESLRPIILPQMLGLGSSHRGELVARA